jgi:hypothetical protein
MNGRNYYIAQSPSGESVVSDLITAVDNGLSWGNTVGVGVVASMMAIALVHFLFWRN